MGSETVTGMSTTLTSRRRAAELPTPVFFTLRGRDMIATRESPCLGESSTTVALNEALINAVVVKISKYLLTESKCTPHPRMGRYRPKVHGTPWEALPPEFDERVPWIGGRKASLQHRGWNISVRGKADCLPRS